MNYLQVRKKKQIRWLQNRMKLLMIQKCKVVLNSMIWQEKRLWCIGWKRWITFGSINLQKEMITSMKPSTQGFTGYIITKVSHQFLYIFLCFPNHLKLLLVKVKNLNGCLFSRIFLFGVVMLKLKWVTVLMSQVLRQLLLLM